MTKNWPTYLQENFRVPETVSEAVDRLMMILNGEQKIAIAVMQKEDLSNLHFSLGMAIRNAFGLHEPTSKLLAVCGVAHPDDASGMIVDALWTKLTQGTK